MPLPLDAIVSFTDGRVRLRHPALEQPGLMEAACSFLQGVEGVTAVQGNPKTGSLLLFYDTEQLSREAILDLAAQGASFLDQSSGSKRKTGSACDSLGKLFLGRKATKMFSRMLFASLLCTLGGAAAGAGAVHKIAGMVFSLACLQHVAAHRKLL